MKLTLNDINEVATISFYGRSGSLFLQSLLDYHPNILMIPGDYMRFYFQWWMHLENRFGNCLDIDFIIKEFDNVFPFISDARESTKAFEGWDGDFGVRLGFTTMGDDQNQFLKINKHIFHKELKHVLEDVFPIKSKDFFKAIHIAYFYALGRVYDSKRLPIIVYHTHIPDVDGPKELFQEFNEVKTICMVREPIQSLGSLINTYRRAGNISIDQMLYILRPLLYDGTTNREKKLSCAVKLEELHTNSKETLEKICDFLNICWSDTLMESTFDGLKWWNAKGSEKVNGFNINIIKRKNEDLFTDFDRKRLKDLLYQKYNVWKYDDYKGKSKISLEDLQKPFQLEKFIYYRNEKEKQIGKVLITNLFKDYLEKVNKDSKDNEVILLE